MAAEFKAALTLHHLRVSQSERILFLLEELNLRYNLITHLRSPVFSPPQLANLPGNHLSAAPVLIDTSAPIYSITDPLTLPESAAIAEYIVQRHGSGRLSLSPFHSDFANYVYWFHFANGNLQPSIFALLRHISAGGSAENPYFKGQLDRFAKLLRHMDERLEQTKAWLAGDDFTIADIMTMFSMTTMRKFYPYSLKGYDGVLAWIGRVRAREGYQRAMMKGDPELAAGQCCNAEPPEPIPSLKAVFAKQGINA